MVKPETYLAIDAGTSSIKVGIVDGEYNIISQNSQKYNFVTPGKDRVELDFRLLRSKILDALKPLTEELSRVKGICFSVLCPGLVPMDREGQPLHNAIIHLDRRSVKQARAALSLIGEKKFLSVAGNLPFPGGISLTSMLWLKQNMPQLYKQAYMLGHTNTFLAKMFTGRFGIDPSNASFTGLYDTVHYSGWSQDIIKGLNLDDNKLPPVYYSDQVIGKTTRHISKLTGIPAGVPVTIGAADTACAALGADICRDGHILNSTGTVEVMVMTLDKPAVDKKLLLRTHPLRKKWLTMNIIGAGGVSVEWFRKNFCREMDARHYYNHYLPQILKQKSTSSVFRPYLAGDRLSFMQKRGSFSNLTLNTDREDMLRALVNGIISPMARAITQFENITGTSDIIKYTGKGSSFLLQVKKDKFFPYRLIPTITNITLVGAARLIKLGQDRD